MVASVSVKNPGRFSSQRLGWEGEKEGCTFGADKPFWNQEVMMSSNAAMYSEGNCIVNSLIIKMILCHANFFSTSKKTLI